MIDSARMKTEKPYNPYFILGVAVVLPGVGHVLNGNPQRGLTFLFFIIVLAWATSKIAPPQASFLGHYAGGLFIYALSILDAYKTARVKWETWRYMRDSPPSTVGVVGRARSKDGSSSGL
jgi:hypothetical protein